jgi:hypothetical protein
MKPLIAMLCAGILLSACGGGGGSGGTPPPPPPPGPSAQDLANAKAAKLGASYALSNHMATLSWTDAFPTTSGFQVQQQAGDGSWSTLETLPGATGTGQTLSWSGTVATATTLRIQAMLTGYSVPLQTAGAQGQLTITPPQSPPTLNIGTASPIAVPTVLSIGNGATYTQVTYSIDSTSIGTSTAAPGYPVDFTPSGTTAGSHVLSANLSVNSDVYLLLQQSVQTASPDLALSLQTKQIVDGNNVPTGQQRLLVAATSDFGITLVSAAIDGVTVGSLTQPNFPACNDCVGNTVYGFVATAPSGSHLVTVTATDGNHETGTLEQQVVFSDPPVLTVTSPAYDGALVNGTLTISGTATTDKSTGVTTVAYLNNVEIMKTTSTPSFTTSYSLAGVTPGTYTLVVATADADGLTVTQPQSITVTSSPSLVYPLFAFAGSLGRMYAAENSTLLFGASDNTFHLRTGTHDVPLQTPTGGPSVSVISNEPWILNNGYAFFSGAASCCGSNAVYAWSPAGVPQNLSGSSGSNVLVAVHWPWVLWLAGATSTPATGTYTFFNMVTPNTLTVPLPAGTGAFNYGLQFALPSPTDFFLSQAAGLTLYYSATVSSNTLPIYLWTQNAGSSTMIPGTAGPILPTLQTDGVRVAWLYSLASGPSSCTNGAGSCYGLQVMDVASNTVQTLSQDATRFYLADGLLAWQETSAQGGGVKVTDGTTTTVLTNRISGGLWGVSNGHVLYQDDGKLYVWSNAKGAVLLYDANPAGALISTGSASTTVFFAAGPYQAIYSVAVQ